MYSPKAVANYFIELAKRDGEEISPMKLQKLVYYAHGWYAGNKGEELIDEYVEAWQYGPVIPSLYHEFKRFGNKPITEMATEFNGDDFVVVPSPSDDDDRKFLDLVWKKYKGYTGIRLSEMTHAIDSPWDQVWRDSHGIRGANIPFDLLRDHFQVSIQKSREKLNAAKAEAVTQVSA